MLVLARHTDCARLLKDPRLSSDYTKGAGYQQLLASGELTPRMQTETDRRWFGFRDPPEHPRQLRLVMKALVPRVVDRLRPRAQTLVDQLLDHSLDRGTDFDLVEDLTLALPNAGDQRVARRAGRGLSPRL